GSISRMCTSPRHGLMFDALGNHKNLARVEGYGAVPKFDVERALEHKEEVIRVIVLVLMERTLELRHHDVVVVVGRDRAWREALSERRELLGEICGLCHFHFPSEMLKR